MVATLLFAAPAWSQTNTRTAVASPSARAPASFHQDGNDNVLFHNTFEADPTTLIDVNERWRGTFHGGGVYPPLQDWIWSPGENGIAGEMSDYAVGSGPAPDGDFVGYLESVAGSTSMFSFVVGLPGDTAAIGKTFRLSFFAAQRRSNGVTDRQVVRVRVSTSTVTDETVFQETIRDHVYRKYVTRPFVATSPSVIVEFAGLAEMTTPNVALLDLVEVREVMPWQASATWGGSAPPTSISDVLIPEDACVGIVTGQANTVTVEGELHAIETAAGSLSTRTVDVHVAAASLGVAPTGTSLFQVGRENVPFLGRFDLVLDDDRTQSLSNHRGDPENWNALHVADDGWVEMHGATRTSWLRLADDAGPGTALGPSTIKLERMPIGWGPGAVLVVAPSGRDFEQAEQRTIQSITESVTGEAVVTLGAPLQHFHCGKRLTVTPPWLSSGNPPFEIDQRAEVGLLSHNARVIAIPRTDVVPPDINLRPGGHVMIEAHVPFLVHPGFGRFSQVELEGLGRAGQLGRYPMHWHLLLGSGEGQYLRDSSIHHSDSRVVAVHGTDGIRFENNVAYEHLGHGVFLEDGSEQGNVFRNNLVMLTRPPTAANALLPSDVGPRLVDGFQNHAPAACWITNPNNVFEGNVVAGADGTGYWFALPRFQWMGSSWSVGAARTYFEARTPGALQRIPVHQILGLFADNSCHSSFMAFDVHDSISEVLSGFGPPGSVETNVTWDPYDGSIASLPRFRAYSCNVGLYTGNGDQNLRFDSAGLADCSWPLVMASHDIVQNSVVVEDSGHGLWPTASPGAPPYFFNGPFRSVGIVLYDGAGEFRNVHFVGFDASTSSAAMWPTGAARRRTNVTMEGLTFATPSGTLIPPRLGLDDVSVVPVNAAFSGFSIHDPRRWAYSIDNPDRTLFSGLGAGTRPLTTVVSNHPMVAGTGFDVPVVAGGTAVASPFRFAYLRSFETTSNGTWVPSSAMHDLRYQRHWTSPPTGTTSPPTGTAAVVLYDDRWRLDQYKQMAVIVDRAGEDNGFRYVLDWFDAGTPDTPSAIPVHSQFWLGEMKPGDIGWIAIKRYAINPATGLAPSVRLAISINNQGQGLHPSLPVPAVNTPQNLATVTTTSMCAESSTGILWLKIMSDNMIPLEQDGTGQAILVDF